MSLRRLDARGEQKMKLNEARSAGGVLRRAAEIYIYI